ncbi:MAG: site-2 protease family protein [Acidobacteria bacterium]|nr:MAG: site-2 protease family protein [Acidobacteriota bacterium]
MKWSWRIGSLFGIPVYIHATFVLILLWVALSHWLKGQMLGATLRGLAFVLALFACVVLHELGHALTARRYRIKTRDITLLPIGGVARLERMPDDPREELWVALAGPAVNVGIAVVLFLLLYAAGSWQPIADLSMTQGSFLERLMLLNVFLVAFNLLPAFPMDGGRVLRALLATRLNYVRSTQIAASIGQAMALLFGFVGFLVNPFLVIIAFFVWIGAAQESSMVEMRTSLAGIPVSQAMQTEFRVLETSDSLNRAVDMILAGAQQDFPVTEGGRLAGVLTRSELLKALAQKPLGTPVSDVMQHNFVVVDSFEMLEIALSRLSECACNTIPVLRNGHLVGLLTSENFGEFMMIKGALAASRQVRRAAA